MKLACRFGWHDGSWSQIKVHYVDATGKSEPTVLDRQQFTCKDCGYMKVEQYVPILYTYD